MTDDLGPRTGRIFDLLQERILAGELAPGTRLPPHTRLAIDFGVAPMTIRTVLARLESAGLVSRQRGRGTFVRTSARPAVLVVGSAHLEELVGERARRTGHRGIPCAGPAEALSVLDSDRSVALVVCELVEADDTHVDFIRAVRRRWPHLPVAVVTASAAALAPLHGTPEFPVLVVPAPVRASQLEEVLRLALPDSNTPPVGAQTTLEALSFRARLLEAVEQAVVATDPQARIVYGDGRLVGIIGVAVDLTDRKHAEVERLERVRLEALLLATEAAQRELSEQLVLNVPDRALEVC